MPPDAEENVIAQVKLIALRFPGEHVLRLIAEPWPPGSIGAGMGIPQPRTLTLGPEWRYDASGPCLAALGEFGAVEHVDR